MADKLNNTRNNSLQYLHVRDWDRWQSYRHDRGLPPWIKVHRRLMRNPSWVALTDAQKGQLVSIWMLAADQNGRVPSSPTLIKRLCCLEHEPDLTMLMSHGFLDAKMTPLRRQVVTPEAEAEAEAEAEKRAEVASLPQQVVESVKGKNGSRLPEDWMPNAKGQALAVELFGEDGAREEYEDFRDYWLPLPGAKGRKLDWDRTWMKWCRNSRRRNGGNGGGNGFVRQKSEKEKYGELLQSLGSGAVFKDTLGILPKLDPDR